MSYTDLDFLAYVLENRWQEDVPGRMQSVPEPKIVIATSEDETRVNTAVNDVIFVRDGGAQTREPRSAGYMAERVETPVAVDIRTAEGRDRFVGIRDDNNEAESYGGLYGETKRILETIRKGEAEYDLTVPPEWNDLSEDFGFGHWRGVWTVRLTQVASEIDP